MAVASLIAMNTISTLKFFYIGTVHMLAEREVDFDQHLQLYLNMNTHNHATYHHDDTRLLLPSNTA